MIECASPVQLRKALEVANLYAKMGINFIPVPVTSEAEQNELADRAFAKLEEIERAADAAETRDAKGGEHGN